MSWHTGFHFSIKDSASVILFLAMALPLWAQTPPEVPNLRDGLGTADVDVIYSSSTYSASWDALSWGSSTPPQRRIRCFVMDMWTEATIADIELTDWTRTSYTFTGLTLEEDPLYVIYVGTSIDGGATYYYSHTDGVTVDLSAPTLPAVASVRDGTGTDVDTIDTTGSYSANWDSITWDSMYQSTSSRQYWCDITDENDYPQCVTIKLPSTQTGFTKTGLSLQIGKKYRCQVTAVYYNGPIPDGGPVTVFSSPTYSDGVTVTSPAAAALPTLAFTSPPQTVTSTTFNVSWKVVGDPSLVSSYEAQYRTGNGRWVSWKNTTQTSLGFTGSNGQTYSFRVRPLYSSGNAGDFVETRTVVTSAGPSVSLSAYPGSLTFAASETSHEVNLTILGSGPGSITLTSIRETRTYQGWGEEPGAFQSINVTVAGGGSQSVPWTVGLDDISRARALGGSTEGSFALAIAVSGRDGTGNPVSASVTIPVTVSGGLPSSLDIRGISLDLPPSPYYPGDVMENAWIVIDATGSGTVVGQILVDGGTGWSSTPSFSASVSGQSSIRIQGQLPTQSPGIHTVTVHILSPGDMTVQDHYDVSSEAAPFPPGRLTLVSGVAELFDLKGTATATSNEAQGYQEYDFTGTAKMKLLSLGNVETSDELTVTSLKVRYSQSDPSHPVIRGGTVDWDYASRGEPSPTITFADGLLKVMSVHYVGNPATPADSLTIDAGIALGDPYAAGNFIHDFAFDNLKGLVVRAGGVEAKSFSWSEAAARELSAFGVRFRMHDVDANTPALSFGREAANGRYFVGLSGSVAWNEKAGSTTESKRLTTFRNLSLYSDGSLNARVAFEPSFAIIPDRLVLTRLEIKEEGGVLGMKLGGELRNLPSPLDRVGPQSFEMGVDANGNAQGDVVLIKELQNGAAGHALGGGDQTEWSTALGTLDLTYIGLHLAFAQGSFNRDHSEARLGADIYMDLTNQDGSTPEPSDRRISFGELDANGTLAGGVVVSMAGDFTWNAPTNTAVLSNKKLHLHNLVLTINALGPGDPSPFTLACTGNLKVDLGGVDGNVGFEGLKIGLDGSLPNISSAITSGTLSMMGFVNVDVQSITWNPQPSTLTFRADGTTGTGTDRDFQQTEPSIQVNSFLKLTGGSVNLGGTSVVMSGQFQELTVYEPVGGETSFVLKKAELEGLGVGIDADIAYQSPDLRMAGQATLPNDITATIVGKIGTKNNSPSMGLFVAVKNLPPIVIGPGVVLNEVGGGLFINPEQTDIDMVKAMAHFEDSALLDRKITDRRPKQESGPGSFGVMIVGGASFASASVLKARAMVTVTANYFTLDAEASFAGGLMKGDAYLAVGWAPAYAEGAFNVKVDFVGIVKGTGNLQFYVYSGDVWGVSGSVGVSLLGADIATGELFVGPPGFMLDAKLSIGGDFGIVSGSVTFEGMLWYYTVPEPDTWGAYASVEVKGEILWGLLSASAKVEGALIGDPDPFIYAVGSVKFKVLFITVFKGSIWVSVGSNGIDGGKGRNDEYDALIDEARQMADSMNDAKEQLNAALEAAKLALYQLNEAQRQAAGLALVERSGYLGIIVEAIFHVLETQHWGASISALPRCVGAVWNLVFGPQQQSIVEARTALKEMIQAINNEIAALDSYHQAVLDKVAAYQDLLVEPLPSIQDLGSSTNPFQGLRKADVRVGEDTKTVTVGFQLDENAASQRRSEYGSVRQAFAEYQDKFIEQAGIMDGKLQDLDTILFQGDENLSALTSRYAGLFTKLGEYLDRYIVLQEQNTGYATNAVATMATMAVIKNIGGTRIPFVGENAIGSEMEDKFATLGSVDSWNEDRISLINALLEIMRAQGVTVNPYTPESDIRLLFIESGKEIWYRTPYSGFMAEIEQAPQRKQDAVDSYTQSVENFRAKWASASSLIATVFDRKADLYDILYEIYDQLAVCGTGMMGIGANGNAAAVSGLSTQGLAFRDAAAAGQIAAQGTPLPARAATPSGLTMTALNQTAAQSGLSGNLQQAAGAGGLCVSVKSYFAAKRREIFPYLEIPTITGLEGSVSSSTSLEAVLTCGFSARHPKGIAEYSCKIEPAQATGRGSGAAASSGSSTQPVAGQAFIADGMTPVGPMGTIASWYAVGNRNQYKEPFFPDKYPAGTYSMYIKVRGAGGKTITRKVTFQLGYADPATGAAYSSNIDTTDTTPPYPPVVTLAQEITAIPDRLYASWGSSDPESGLQSYQYAVGTQIAGGSANPTNILSWTDAGGRTEANIRGLRLETGKRYIVSVRATNGVGLTSIGGSSPVLVDLTPPTAGTIWAVQGTVDGHPNTLRFSFAPGTDPETGVVSRSVAVGTSATKDDLFPWTVVTGTSGSFIDLPLLDNGKVYMLVKTMNGVGLETPPNTRELTCRFTDSSAPDPVAVLTLPQSYSADRSNLSIGWYEAADGQSGIVSYDYGIGRSPTSADVFGWTRAPLQSTSSLVCQGDGQTMSPAGDIPIMIAQTGVTGFAGTLDTPYRVALSGLNLPQGVPLYALVKITNGKGLARVCASQSLIVDSTPPAGVSLTAAAEQTSLSVVHTVLSATDNESGISRFRYSVWRADDLAANPQAAPLATSAWLQAFSAGPPASFPQSVDISVWQIPGFAFGVRHVVRIEVGNSSGLTTISNPVTVRVVTPPVDIPGSTGGANTGSGLTQPGAGGQSDAGSGSQQPPKGQGSGGSTPPSDRPGGTR